MSNSSDAKEMSGSRSDGVPRYVILDTETTGLEHAQGHRIIEFAGLEMINRKLTGKHLHLYIHPEREIDRTPSACTASRWNSWKASPSSAKWPNKWPTFCVARN